MNDETPNEQMKTEETEEAQLQDDQVEEIKESNGTNTGEEESKDQLNLAMQESKNSDEPVANMEAFIETNSETQTHVSDLKEL